MTRRLRASKSAGTPVRLLAAGAALLLAAALAGCGASDADDSGSSSSGSSANVEEAEARLAKVMEEPEWKEPGPAFDASKASGKKIMYIGVDNSIPIVQTIFDSLSEAAGLLDVKVDTCDGKGQVSNFNECMEQAISQKYDAISVLAIPSDLISGALKDAKAANIPVIQVQEHDPGATLADGVSADVSFCYSCAGRTIADWVIADSGGDAKGAIFISSDVSNGEDEAGGMMDEFEELCPDCDFETIDVPIAKWQSDIPTLTQSILLKDPEIEYLLPLYDSMTDPMLPAISLAGKDGTVKVASWNATPNVMQQLGKGPVKFDVGGANVWFGYGLADQFFRLLAGVDPVKDENIPNRAFSEENIDTIDLDAAESTWYGDTDFRANYKELWGL